MTDDPYGMQSPALQLPHERQSEAILHICFDKDAVYLGVRNDDRQGLQWAGDMSDDLATIIFHKPLQTVGNHRIVFNNQDAAMKYVR